jgi:hypothetical protein
MTARPSRWLEARGAHHDLVSWAEAFDTLDAMWTACPRGDWLLGIAVARALPPALVEDAMLAAATLALDHVYDADRPRLADLLAAPRERRIEAAPAVEAQAAAASSPALAAALGALAIALSGRIEDAASVAALVSQAAVFDAGDCAMMPALSYAQKRSAELVRAVIPSIA